MANTNQSANMLLPVPAVGIDPGPQYATDTNNCLTIIDAHDHSPGHGVQVGVSGININADLPFNGNNATILRTAKFLPQTSSLDPIVSPQDINVIYSVGNDLWYNNGAGLQIQITNNSGVVGSPGSISNLVAPASASYSAVNQSFVWQSGVNQAANLDAASIILRNTTASSHGVTLNPPNPVGAVDYSLTLPGLPSSQSFMTLDASGQMAAPWTVDNTTIDINANKLEVKAGGIDMAQLSAAVQAAIAASVPTGSILPFGGPGSNVGGTPPTGYLFCDGASYLRASYVPLFSVIGIYNGSADSTHFNVPDLRGQFLRGVSGTSGNDPDALTRTWHIGANPSATKGQVGSLQDFNTSAAPLTLSDPGHVHSMAIVGTGTGTITNVASGGAGAFSTGASTTGISLSGGSETRPVNVYVNYIIKT